MEQTGSLDNVCSMATGPAMALREGEEDGNMMTIYMSTCNAVYGDTIDTSSY